MLKHWRIFRNRAEIGFEDKIWSLFRNYDTKWEACFGGDTLNGVNCRRWMDKNEEIINSIRDIFLIETNKDTLSDDNINMYCDKQK